MNKAIITILFLLPGFLFAQFPFGTVTEPTSDPIVHYYHFYNGIQMIEFDYLTAYHRRVNYLEQAQPRALTWEMVLGPPHQNVYLLRNKKGEIVKHYGGYVDESILLSVEESMKSATYHNSFFTQFGSSLGFSGISTRYNPYYLIGGRGNVSDIGLIGVGLIDSLGNVALPQEYAEIYKHGNQYITWKDSTNELRDSQLNIMFSSHEYALYPAQFHNDYVCVMKDDKLGLMDATGTIIVPCKYDMQIKGFNELGLAEVVKDGRIGFIDSTGNEVIKCKYQSVGEFKEGLLDVRLNDKWGYINAKGETVIPHRYEIGIWFEEGLARVAIRKPDNYYFGYIDREGNEVIPLIYTNAKDFDNGVAEVMLDGKWIKIDKKGNLVGLFDKPNK